MKLGLEQRILSAKPASPGSQLTALRIDSEKSIFSPCLRHPWIWDSSLQCSYQAFPQRAPGCHRGDQPHPTHLRRVAKGPGGLGLGPKPDKIGAGGQYIGPRARWDQDSRPAPPVGLPSGCGLCPISESALRLLSSPTRQDFAAPPPVSLGILLDLARPASPPLSPGPGYESQDFMWNRNS